MSACTRLATRLLETQLVLSGFAHIRISHSTNPALFPPPFAADPGTQIGVSSVYVSLLPTGRLMGS